ncbi:flagellin [Natranaerofaba carboxydovora]|uniref:flagellin N-terminal helical domain-containing protein n=1 Tax=Natranaerofaba carboxydovora TaxID=2742683 RepID=UPI001F134249|nr:flagellin [Natranaerofaba carboxydovora]UMZ74991.1 B-type flagellin [Natranaerofaba carboxydovora]
MARINTNIEAMNAHRQLQRTNENMQTSMERLSSGQRINRAADDAAGLSISEKMRGQVNGLNQAVSNAQDAISLIQTAEGALEETHGILQRMRELAVQSANDTNIDDDRGAMQDEMDQLAEELSRIAETTEFNTQELLDDTFEGTFHIGANEGQNVDLAIDNMGASALGVGEGGNVSFELTTDNIDDLDDLDDTALEGEETYELEVVDLGEIYEVDTDEFAQYALVDEDGNARAVSNDGEVYDALEDTATVEELREGEADVDDDAGLDFDAPVTSGEVYLEITETDSIASASATATVDLENDLESGTYEVIEGGDIDGVDDDGYALIREGDDVETDNVVAVIDSDGNNIYSADDIDLADNEDWDDADPIASSTDVDLHELDTIDVTAEGGLDIQNQDSADSAISTIDDAIDTVSSQRSELGALQNRLEHTIANLSVASENLEAAESRIRDADMAEEMMDFSRHQVLEEAGTAMMAQANMQPQGVLQLLQ